MLTTFLLGMNVMAAPSPSTQAEIHYLLDHLARSGCEFNRNGTWYPSSDARAHIDKKYRYLLRKNLAQTTEDFITHAASKSSTSGKAYQVRCAGQPPRDSGPWLTEALQRYRQPRVNTPAVRTLP